MCNSVSDEDFWSSDSSIWSFPTFVWPGCSLATLSLFNIKARAELNLNNFYRGSDSRTVNVGSIHASSLICCKKRTTRYRPREPCSTKSFERVTGHFIAMEEAGSPFVNLNLLNADLVTEIFHRYLVSSHLKIISMSPLNLKILGNPSKKPRDRT